MAELVLKLLGDIKDIENKLKTLFNKEFNIKGKVSSGNSTGNGITKEDEKQSDLLSGILKGLAPLAILSQIKPVIDLISIGINLIGVGILKLLQSFGILGTGKTINDRTDIIEELILSIIEVFKNSLKVVSPGLANTVEDWMSTLSRDISDGEVDITSLLFSPVKSFISSIGEWFANNISTISDFIQKNIFLPISNFFVEAKFYFDELVSKVSNWVETYITSPVKSVFSAVREWINNALSKLGLNNDDDNNDKRFSVRRGSSGGITEVDDAIITKNGQVIKTNPNDTIIATQTPNNISNNKSTIINMYGVTPQEMIDTLRREFGIGIIKQGRF